MPESDSSSVFAGLSATSTGSPGWLHVLSCHTVGLASSFRGRWAKVQVLGWKLGRTEPVFPFQKGWGSKPLALPTASLRLSSVLKRSKCYKK